MSNINGQPDEVVVDYRSGKLDIQPWVYQNHLYGGSSDTPQVQVEINSHTADGHQTPHLYGKRQFFVSSWSISGQTGRLPSMHLTGWPEGLPPPQHSRLTFQREDAFTIPRNSKLWNEVMRELNEIANPFLADKSYIQAWKLAKEVGELRRSVRNRARMITDSEQRYANIHKEYEALAADRGKLREFLTLHPEFDTVDEE